MAKIKEQPTQDEEDEHEDDDSHQCPVCLTLTDQQVCGPCGHSSCIECIEQILNANGNLTRWPPVSAADTHLSAPTKGRCPICRSELSLFDIVYKDTGEPLHRKDTEYLKERDNEKDALPLKDAVYVPYHGKVGQLSFHWEKNGDEEDDTNCTPYLNISKPLKANKDRWQLEDGSYAPAIKHFQPGSHFHKESGTFHGKISWAPSRLNGSYEWDVVLGFPPDFRFLRSGQIHMRRERIVKERDLPATYTSEQRQLCRFPMDGRWTVSWKTKDGDRKQLEIHVKNHEYRQSGWSFYLHFEDPEHPTIRWPKSNYIQRVEEGVDLLKEPIGPSVGAKVRWTTTSPNFPELFWERQTIGPVPSPHVILFGMGPSKQLYQRLDANFEDVSTIPKYHGESIWGNVFCKQLFVGSASYHFLSPTTSFLSYRHPACRDLPPMDDGAPLPTRVNFHDMKWEEEELKLTCNIEWEKDFGTSWNENVRWKLTMYFDTEFMTIIKGGIQVEWCRENRARPKPPRQPNPHRPKPVAVYVPPKEEQKAPDEPKRNEEWVMSGYGHDQLYINAACLERYRGGDAIPDFKALGVQHCKRLQHEGATKRSLGFMNHVFELAAKNPNSSPIDFLL